MTEGVVLRKREAVPDPRASIWRRFTLLTLLGAAGGALFVPFIAAGSADTPDLPVLLASFTIGSAFVTGLAALFGLRWADQVGCPMPWLRAWEAGERPEIDWRTGFQPAIFGAGLGILAACVATLIGVPENPGSLFVRLATVPFAAIVPEVLVHLFVMSGLVLVLKRGGPAIFLSALVFVVIFHGNPPGDDVVVPVFIVGLNFSLGLLTGWLYWARGFAAAVLAHGAAHFLVLAIN